MFSFNNVVHTGKNLCITTKQEKIELKKFNQIQHNQQLLSNTEYTYYTYICLTLNLVIF